MLPKLSNVLPKAALVTSLLLGTSALALAQNQQGSSSATGQPESSAPAGTQMGPRKAEPQHPGTNKSSEAKPNQPGTSKSSEATPNQPGTTKSSEAAPNQAGKTKSSEATSNQPNQPNQPGTNKSSASAGQGNATEPGKAPATAATGGNNPSASTSASKETTNLTTTQKTEIHKTIVSDNSAPRADNVNITLNVGVAVPPTVKFAPLPPKIVSIEPAWRGYEYFLYRDQVVIIEPGTRRIVAILVG